MDLELHKSELGKKSIYESQYNAGLLFPIARDLKRNEIGINSSRLPFYGTDIWTHYELSWLNPKGKPVVGIGKIFYPANSKNIIESKSMKLYFNSFNNTRFNSEEEVVRTVIQDISSAVEAQAGFKFIRLIDKLLTTTADTAAICLDELDVECSKYQPHAEYLCTENSLVSETLYSNLLKSNCLVTNQPDWGTLFIEYRGKRINHEGLLKYIVSLRDHNEFHEQCVERVFSDIEHRCAPEELTVYARYTRRGGLDINPYRSTRPDYTPNDLRLIRQ